LGLILRLLGFSLRLLWLRLLVGRLVIGCLLALGFFLARLLLLRGLLLGGLLLCGLLLGSLHFLLGRLHLALRLLHRGTRFGRDILARLGRLLLELILLLGQFRDFGWLGLARFVAQGLLILDQLRHFLALSCQFRQRLLRR